MNYLNNYVQEIEQYKQLSKEEEKTATPEELVLANLKFVIKIAHEYKQFNDIQDLIQEGNKGLIEAANKFDTSKNIKFITYAVFYIRKYMWKCVCDKLFMVKGAWKIKDTYQINYVDMYKENNPIEQIINKNSDDSLYDPSILADINIDKNDTIRASIAELSDIEKNAINLRYGIPNGNHKTLKKVAAELNCSVAFTKATLIKAHSKLKKKLKHSIY